MPVIPATLPSTGGSRVVAASGSKRGGAPKIIRRTIARASAWLQRAWGASERLRPAPLAEKTPDAVREAVGERRAIGLIAEPPAFDGMIHEGELDQDAGGMRADEHVERTALHAEVLDAVVAGAHVAEELLVHGRGEPARVGHLSALYERAEDVAQIGPRAADGIRGRGVLDRGEAHRGRLVAVVEDVRLDALRAAGRIRVGVDGHEEVRARLVRDGRPLRERHGRVAAPREDDLGAEVVAEPPREPPNDVEGHVLLDDEPDGARVVPAVAWIEHDAEGARGRRPCRDGGRRRDLARRRAGGQPRPSIRG